MFIEQFKAILKKNIIIHLRSGAFFKEVVNIVIMLVVIIVINKTEALGISAQIPFYMSIAIMLFCKGVGQTWVAERQSKQA